MYKINSLNFVPIIEKRERKLESDKTSIHTFVAKTEKGPMKSVYNRVNRAQYSRIIYGDKKDEE
ncbi:hypothetical protein [Longibaculum muris]|uniref:hypothetical protein n=1 Tax=Longibaculum muris TaxID=1796628 RepID=UPI0012B835A0|nr:hypothetical protein [Longibaculum muris]